MEPKDRILVALDVSDVELARSLVESLRPHVGGFKVGLELQSLALSSLVSDQAEVRLQALRGLFQSLTGVTFWDGKWADIPNTLAGAAKALQSLAPTFLNLHASTGLESIKAVVANKGTSKVLGVTVLTSISEEECLSVFGKESQTAVLHFASLLVQAGADGIICSPQELEALGREGYLDHLVAVVPGVRPAWAATGDQKRVMTPADAIEAGATYLVIGRPITKPPEAIEGPVEAAKKIAEEIGNTF